MAVFALNGYVTTATSLDPLENDQLENTKSENDDTRTKRSGNILSSLVKKKLGLFSSLTGSSSGKSIGSLEHYEEPLVGTFGIVYLGTAIQPLLRWFSFIQK